jgi:hypothetical protein
MTRWNVGFLLSALLLTACGDASQIHRTLKAVGPDKLREQAVAACGNQFPRADAIKIVEPWPPAVRAFRPLSVWAEPDGVYLLLDSDAAGERGVFVPRVLSETDPICGPKLKHVKLASGVYWYERAR